MFWWLRFSSARITSRSNDCTRSASAPDPVALGEEPPPGAVFGIGVLLLVCTILYALPWTAVLGAVLLTGYLGGAVALQVRVAVQVRVGPQA